LVLCKKGGFGHLLVECLREVDVTVVVLVVGVLRGVDNDRGEMLHLIINGEIGKNLKRCSDIVEK
jgi:hypothetical protein